jgi:hypothetical protein
MLTRESHTKLANLFVFRKVIVSKAKKYAVPIGLQELTIRNVIERTTKKGKRMVELRIYMKPAEVVYGVEVMNVCPEVRLSFAPIRCFHVEGYGSIKTFYRRISTMSPSDLDKLSTLKGKRFKGLIMHTAEDWVKDGVIVRGEDGKRLKFWAHEIVDVCRLDKEIGFDYFDLVKEGEQDVKLKKEIIAPF